MADKEWFKTYFELLKQDIFTLSTIYSSKVEAHKSFASFTEAIGDVVALTYVQDKATDEILRNIVNNLNILMDFIEYSIDNIKDEDEDEK